MVEYVSRGDKGAAGTNNNPIGEGISNNPGHGNKLTNRQQLHYATTLGTIMTVIVINGTRTISLTIFFFVFPPAPPQ